MHVPWIKCRSQKKRQYPRWWGILEMNDDDGEEESKKKMNDPASGFSFDDADI